MKNAGQYSTGQQTTFESPFCKILQFTSRSTARLSSGQRTALNDVEEVHSEERDGQTYYVYEHTSQVSWRRCQVSCKAHLAHLTTAPEAPGDNAAPMYTCILCWCTDPLPASAYQINLLTTLAAAARQLPGIATRCQRWLVVKALPQQHCVISCQLNCSLEALLVLSQCDDVLSWLSGISHYRQPQG
jgi:hypothetical protein